MVVLKNVTGDQIVRERKEKKRMDGFWKVVQNPGLPDGIYFQTKHPNFGKFWSVIQWKKLVNSMAIWKILLPFGIFYGHLVYFVAILVYFSSFSMLYQEKSGNPVQISSAISFQRTLLLSLFQQKNPVSVERKYNVAQIWFL
jgi:hypothetical protein